MTQVTWYGHSAFKLDCEDATILIDPFLDDNPSCPIKSADVGPVDLILVTHDHADHVGQAVEICRATGAMLGAVVGTAEKLQQSGVPPEKICCGVGFNIGGTMTFKDIRITMVPAFHTTDSGTPVGYLITLPDGKTLYHAGDTAVFGDMALWGHLYPIDLALLPIGGIFTMDAFQAAMACKLLQCKQVLPMHWGTFPILDQSTVNFKRELAACAPACRCIDTTPGAAVRL